VKGHAFGATPLNEQRWARSANESAKGDQAISLCRPLIAVLGLPGDEPLNDQQRGRRPALSRIASQGAGQSR
jgi:hypothetical protein